MNGAFGTLREIAMDPSEAYAKLVKGKTEYVPVGVGGTHLREHGDPVSARNSAHHARRAAYVEECRLDRFSQDAPGPGQ